MAAPHHTGLIEPAAGMPPVPAMLLPRLERQSRRFYQAHLIFSGTAVGH